MHTYSHSITTKKKQKIYKKKLTRISVYNLNKRPLFLSFSIQTSSSPHQSSIAIINFPITISSTLDHVPPLFHYRRRRKKKKKEETEWGPSFQLRRYSKIYFQEVEARVYANRNSDSKVCNKRRRRVNENGRWGGGSWRKRLSKLAAEIHYEGGGWRREGR